MSYVDDLKLIVAKHRWALEDLVYDELNKEHNHLSATSAKNRFNYLREVLGGGGKVVDLSKRLLASMRRSVVIDTGSPQGDLFKIAQAHDWVFDELIAEHHDSIWHELRKSANAMFQYLIKKKGDGPAVLKDLQYLIRHQGTRRKTLHLVTE